MVDRWTENDLHKFRVWATEDVLARVTYGPYISALASEAIRLIAERDAAVAFLRELMEAPNDSTDFTCGYRCDPRPCVHQRIVAFLANLAPPEVT